MPAGEGQDLRKGDENGKKVRKNKYFFFYKHNLNYFVASSVTASTFSRANWPSPPATREAPSTWSSTWTSAKDLWLVRNRAWIFLAKKVPKTNLTPLPQTEIQRNQGCAGHARRRRPGAGKSGSEFRVVKGTFR